jgi:hypothetical protein
MAGNAARPVWVLEPWTFRKGDLLIAYMQTRPAMAVFLDKFYETSRDVVDYIPSQTVALFKHGVPLGIIAAETGIDLTKVDDYLTASEARAVVKTIRREYARDRGIFGDNRMCDLT